MAQARSVQTEDNSVAPSAPWPSGQSVVAKGLTGAKQLNGASGKILHFDASRGRYAVDFGNGDGGKLLKPENLELAKETQRDMWKAIFASEPATPKLTRLASVGTLGFEHFEDADLRRLLKRLIEAGYWAKSPPMQEQLGRQLKLAELPSGLEAIAIIQQLQTTCAEDMNSRLEEMGKKVRADEGLSHIFSELKTMGHQFGF